MTIRRSADNDDRTECRRRLLPRVTRGHHPSPSPTCGHRPDHVTPTTGPVPKPPSPSLRPMSDGRNRGPWRRDDYQISTDPDRLDVDRIHAFLHDDAYWARGVPRQVVERTIAHSLNFGLFHEDDGQVGFARVVTDYGVIAYLPTCSCCRRIRAEASAAGWSRPWWPIPTCSTCAGSPLRPATRTRSTPRSASRRTLDRGRARDPPLAHRAVRHPAGVVTRRLRPRPAHDPR